MFKNKAAGSRGSVPYKVPCRMCKLLIEILALQRPMVPKGYVPHNSISWDRWEFASARIGQGNIRTRVEGFQALSRSCTIYMHRCQYVPRAYPCFARGRFWMAGLPHRDTSSDGPLCAVICPRVREIQFTDSSFGLPT